MMSARGGPQHTGAVTLTRHCLKNLMHRVSDGGPELVSLLVSIQVILPLLGKAMAVHMCLTMSAPRARLEIHNRRLL